MSTSQDDIRVRIAGDLSDIKRSLKDLRKQTREAGNVAKQTRNDWRQLGRGLDTVRKRVKGLIGTYVGFRAVQSLIGGIIRNTARQEEAIAQLEARLRSTGGVAGVTSEQLQALASSLQGVTKFSDEAIIAMQGVLLTFTQVRGDVFVDATESILDMSAALGRDLQSSALQVGKALNDPIKGVAQLRESGVQLTAQQAALVRSFVETGDIASAQRVILSELETQFGGTARAAGSTFGGSLERLKNAAGDLLEGDGGNLEDARTAVEDLIDVLRDPQTKEAFATITESIVTVGRVTTEAVVALSNFSTDFRVLTVNIGRRIRGIPTDAESAAERLEAVRERIQQLEDGQGTRRGRPFSASERALERLRAEAEELARLVEAYERLESRRNETDGSDSAVPPANTGGGQRLDPRLAIRALQSDLAAAGVVLEDELSRLGRTLDQDFEDNLLRFSEFFARRAELQRRAIDQDLASRRASLDLLNEEIRLIQQRGDSTEKAEAERAKLIASITVLERRRADVAVAATRSQADAEADLAKQLEQVRLRLLAAQGETAMSRTARLEDEFSELIARLRIEGDAEGEALVRQLIDVEAAKARLAELEMEYERSLRNLAREEQRVQAQIDTGTISEREGRLRIIDLHERTALKVSELIPLMRDLAEATGDPAALERLMDTELQLEQLGNVADRIGMQIRDSVQDAGENAFSSFITGAQDARDAWESFVDAIRQRAADLISERIFDQLFGVFGNGGAGGNNPLGGLAGILAGLFHDGGIAGAARQHRRVPAIAFAEAPRLHRGGIAGFAANEVPAILQRGEEVITRDDPRHTANGRGDINVNIYAQDANSFSRQSPGQLGAQIANELRRSRNRNG